MFRAQGLRQYYAARLTRTGKLQVVCRRDEVERVLAETALPVAFETAIPLRVRLDGAKITVDAGGTVLEVSDGTYAGGMIGLAVYEGALSTDKVHIGRVR